MKKLGSKAMLYLLIALVFLMPISAVKPIDDPVMETKSFDLVKVTIIKPVENGLYLFDRLISPLPHVTIIIGNITVLASAISIIGIDKLEFYVDDTLKHTETDRLLWLLVPWNWDETIFFKHTLKVDAYDNLGGTASDEIEVWIFNLNL